MLIEDFLAFSTLARREWSAQCVGVIHFSAWIASFIKEIALAATICVMRGVHRIFLSKAWVLILGVLFAGIRYVKLRVIGRHILIWCQMRDVAHPVLVRLNGRSDFYLSFEHNHVVIYPEQILFIYLNLSLAKQRLVSYYNNLNKILVESAKVWWLYLRNLNLLLKLLDLVIFVLFLHPTQINVALNLWIVFLALGNSGLLLRNLELDWVWLERVFVNLFLKSPFLQRDIVFSDRLIISHLLDPSLASFSSILSLRQSPQYVTSDSVNVQLGLARHAAHSKVACLILRVKLREGERLQHAIWAAVGSTEFALGDLFLERILGFATHTTIILLHKRIFDFLALSFLATWIWLKEREDGILCVKWVAIVVLADSNHSLSRVEYVRLVDCQSFTLHTFVKLIVERFFVLHQFKDALVYI